MKFRYEFPPDVEAERETVFEVIRQCLSQGTPASVTEASQAQIAWLERYPDDYAMWDAGEPISLLADALEIVARENQAGKEQEMSVPASRAA